MKRQAQGLTHINSLGRQRRLSDQLEAFDVLDQLLLLLFLVGERDLVQRDHAVCEGGPAGRDPFSVGVDEVCVSGQNILAIVPSLDLLNLRRVILV